MPSSKLNGLKVYQLKQSIVAQYFMAWQAGNDEVQGSAPEAHPPSAEIPRSPTG